uniref:ArsR family transcriptional regulator n=1 Tax=Desulfobacca acetoxidans TaxID=60893 RepID=A0A7V4LCB0_9BACT
MNPPLNLMVLLLEGEELCVCDLGESLGLAQSEASRRLRRPSHTGWVQDRRHGLKDAPRLNLPQESWAALQLESR